MSPDDPSRTTHALDSAVVREAVFEVLRQHEAQLRQCVQEAIVAHPELLALEAVNVALPARADALIERLVDQALARRTAAGLTSAARALALFPERAGKRALPAAKVHFVERRGDLEIAAALQVEPLEASVARDPHPLPALEDREGYHSDRHFDYWLSGLEDFLRVRATLARHGHTLAAGQSVFELGCASGRVLRHFLCQLDGLDVWGADLNERHVVWLLEHLPGTLKVFQCSSLPSLPLAGDSLDLVTAFSVFTHIDEFELGWLLELRRALRPGGVAYLTIHSDSTWNRTRPGGGLYEHLQQPDVTLPGYKIGPALFERPMPRDRLVFRWRGADVNDTHVFVNRRYVHGVWGRFFEVLEIVDQGSGYQDVVVLRKPG